MNGFSKLFRTIGWGVYCACSWTWCIGMFLPIIMLRDWGWPGFLVFAVPNVLGCAAFGYVLKTRARSEALLARHGWAAVAFSLVTIAYHLFFAGFLTIRLGAGAESIQLLPAITLALSILLIGIGVGGLPVRAWPVLALLAYGVSIAAFIAIGDYAFPLIQWQGLRGRLDLWCIAPAIAFGFLLCPYLDLTFHRALRESPSRHAFGVFGLTFAVMILLTCAYVGLGKWPIDTLFADNQWAARLLIVHLYVQMVFTVAAHWREMRNQIQTMNAQQVPAPLARNVLDILPIVPLASLVLIATAALFRWSFQTNEDIYIRWLGFYGLVFPAYVVIFIGPWKIKSLTRANLLRFLITIIALTPLYELGFVHAGTPVLLPAVALLLALAWLTPRTAPPRLSDK